MIDICFTTLHLCKYLCEFK